MIYIHYFISIKYTFCLNSALRMEQGKYLESPNQDQGEEIDLKKLFKTLLAKKFLIAGITSFVTVLSIIYALNLAPTYKSTSLFTKPTSISISTINQLNLISTTKGEVFSEFLSQMSSESLQTQVLLKDNFYKKFHTGLEPIDSIENFIIGIINGLLISPPDLTTLDIKLGFLNIKPYSASMEGSNAEAISEYLDKLIALANSKTLLEFSKLSKLKVAFRIKNIITDRNNILEISKMERLGEIKRINNSDDESIRKVNGEIDRARIKEKTNRLNQIIILTDSLKLAKSLGVLENNFKMIDNNLTESNLTIAFGENKNLPEWYMYGEKALKQRIELLVNRRNDDPFIPELVKLNSQLNEIQNNTALETLQKRLDDSPYVEGINKLDAEKIQLELSSTNLSGANTMHLIHSAKSSNISLSKRRIVLLSFIGSFMMSILLVLIMDFTGPRKKPLSS